MNKARRKLVSEAFDLVGKAKGILENVKSAEQEAYDNLPESFQNGGRGEDIQECIEMIEEGFNLLDDTKARKQRSQPGYSEKAQPDRTVSQQNPEISPGQLAALNRELECTGVPLEMVLDRYQLTGMNGMTADIYEKAMGCLRRSKDRAA